MVPFKRLLMQFGRRKCIRSSKLLAKILFGYCPIPKNNDLLWDFTTLIFRSALRKWVSTGNTVLEIGTGDTGTLSIYIAKKIKGCHQTAVDINPAYIENAKVNAQQQKMNIHFLQGDMFEYVVGRYDVIFFNPPYVPSTKLDIRKNKKYHGFSSDTVARQTSDGGFDGMAIVRRYLNEAKRYLAEQGILLLGTNLYYIGEKELAKLIVHNQYRTIDVMRSQVSDSAIYVLSALR